MSCSSLLTLAVTMPLATAALGAPVWPGKTWATRKPAEAGLDAARLKTFSDYVRGRGCIVRHGRLVYTWGDYKRRGDVASAAKPVYAHFLFEALEDGRIASLDERVAKYEPRLAAINASLDHKDRLITWRHLANQTSCYGVAEKPGSAFCYNDWQMALFWDTLFLKVYRADLAGVDAEVLHPFLTDPIQCEDNPTFLAFGLKDRPGRLSISPRDFARFGLLYLRNGIWKGRRLISIQHARMAVSSTLPNSLPRAGMQPAEMIPGQRTIGSRRIPDNQTDHFGSYSWLWWTNGVDRSGKRHWPGAPYDTYGALGHGGRRVMIVIPSFDLIVSWNDSIVQGPAMENRALTKLVAAVRDAPWSSTGTPRTRISIDGRRWRLNGRVTYPGTPAEGLLMNVRMVNAVFEDANRPGFDADANTSEFIARIPEYVANGVRAFTINLQGGWPGYEGALCSAFNPDGSLRQGYMRRVRRVIEACDRHGAAVILGCYYQRQDQVLRDGAAVRAGVEHVVAWLREGGWTHVLLEIANEFGHAGFDHRLLKTSAGQVELIRVAKRAAPNLLVSASVGGSGVLPEAVARASDFLLIHFNNTRIAAIPKRIAALRPYGKPIVCNEDAKVGARGARAAEACVAHQTSWGLMQWEVNQRFPFHFRGVADAPVVYAALQRLTHAARPTAQ
ncbi:MAG: beta-lactamase family protein [Kiritimatiellaeota bacterium]|nr:beta-lactamase family protein [Kiritimatiellota bacterium]